MTPSLCAGLALLGLCVPLPGHSLQSVLQAGWRNEAGKDGWFSSRLFSSGTYQLSVLVTGDEPNVAGVLLSEESTADQGDPKSPLNTILSQACATKDGKETCVIAGVKFARMPCVGGWQLYRVGADITKARALCDRVAPLFDDLRRSRK